MSQASVLICPVCQEHHGTHGSVGSPQWIAAEQVRRSAQVFPVEALGPLRQGREYCLDPYYRGMGKNSREDPLWFSWGGYFAWLKVKSSEVHQKTRFFVTNPSMHRGQRQDQNQWWFDRIYLDCDEAGPWDRFVAFCEYYGIPAIFHESAGSVRDRTHDGDFNGPPRAWHVEIPLARRVHNRWGSSSNNPSSDPRWGHYMREVKRATQHAFAFFSAFSFGGVGGKCGFDLAPTGLCVPRFLGTRSEPNGPLPHLFILPGHNALDWDRFLQVTGFAWKDYTPPESRVKKVRVQIEGGGVRERTVVRYDRQLYEDVKKAVSVHEFLQVHLGRQPTTPLRGGKAYYFCPIHNEELNPSGRPQGPNRQGFHVFYSSMAGIEMWKCHGDCNDRGSDVVALAEKVWGISNGKAVWKLAVEAGLDPKQYLAQAGGPDEPPPEEDLEEEQPADEAFDAQEDDAPRPRKKTKAKQLDHVADWIEKWLLGCKKPGTAVRSVARMLVEGKSEGEKKQRRMVSVRRDPDVVAATLYSVLYDDLTLAQAQGEVYDVVDRLQEGRPCSGRGWVRDSLGYESLFELAGTMWRDDLKAESTRPFMDYARETLSFDRLSIKGSRVKIFMSTLVKWITANVPAPSEEKANKERSALIKQVERPTACKAFYQEVTTTFGRDLGRRWVVCLSRSCTHCRMVEALCEWDILLPAWRKIGGPFHFVKIVLQDLEQVPDLKQYMRKLSRPNLSVIGFEGSNPFLLYAVTDLVDQAYVSGSACGWRGREIHVRRNHAMRQSPPVESFSVSTPSEALGLVMQAKLSYHVRLRELIHRGTVASKTGVGEGDEHEKIIEFMRWSHRRQVVVSRSKKGLPWATKEQLKAARNKDRDDMAPGESRIFALHHSETGYKLGTRQDVPFTCDESVAMAKQSQGLKQARATKRKSDAQKNPQARARAPAV